MTTSADFSKQTPFSASIRAVTPTNTLSPVSSYCRSQPVPALSGLLQSERNQLRLANLKGITPEHYAIYKIAKSLYSGTAEVGVDELADPELVNTESFHLVINAMLIYRYRQLLQNEGCVCCLPEVWLL